MRRRTFFARHVPPRFGNSRGSPRAARRPAIAREHSGASARRDARRKNSRPANTVHLQPAARPVPPRRQKGPDKPSITRPAKRCAQHPNRFLGPESQARRPWLPSRYDPPQQGEQINRHGGQHDGRTGRGRGVKRGDQPHNPGEQGDGDRPSEKTGRVARQIPASGRGENEQGIDHQDADPRERTSHDHGKKAGEDQFGRPSVLGPAARQ